MYVTPDALDFVDNIQKPLGGRGRFRRSSTVCGDIIVVVMRQNGESSKDTLIVSGRRFSKFHRVSGKKIREKKRKKNNESPRASARARKIIFSCSILTRTVSA